MHNNNSSSGPVSVVSFLCYAVGGGGAYPVISKYARYDMVFLPDSFKIIFVDKIILFNPIDDLERIEYDVGGLSIWSVLEDKFLYSFFKRQWPIFFGTFLYKNVLMHIHHFLYLYMSWDSLVNIKLDLAASTCAPFLNTLYAAEEKPSSGTESEAAPSTNDETPPSVEDKNGTSEVQDAAENPEAEETNTAAEETPAIETAPADFRFPTTNQTRHCFTRYVEYHRCVAAKGEDAPECDKFAKYYRSLCPGEW
ncbi:hypothetical protein ACJX0J_006878, partial [Zea mays]